MLAIVRNRLAQIVKLNSRFKSNIDYSKVPVLNESDIEENFIKGGGPGGQKINKSTSCVFLRHIPTGLIVKCQETRLLNQNRKIARTLLISKLDNYFNGENSVENQIKNIEHKKSDDKQRKRLKRQQMKEEWLKKEQEDRLQKDMLKKLS